MKPNDKRYKESIEQQMLIESIKLYRDTIQSEGNPAAGYHIATGCALFDDLDTLSRVTLGNCYNGAKPAAVSLNIVDAICEHFKLNPSTLAAKMHKFGRDTDRKNWDKWAAERLELKARLALGNWLLDMVQRANLYEIVRGDSSLAANARSMPTALAPYASILRDGKRVKGFQARSDTLNHVEQMWAQAAAWRDSEGGPSDILKFRPSRSRSDDELSEKVWSREPYYMLALGKKLVNGPSYTATQPFTPWKSKGDGGHGCIDADGRKLLDSRYFKLDDRQMDAPWVHAVNRLESVGYRVNEKMLEFVQQVQDEDLFATNSPKKQAHRQGAIDTAKELGDQAFYNRAFADFRGRLYLSKSDLQYQGSEFVRSLMDLAEGQPLTEQGFDALLLHTANCHGDFDELGRAERIEKARQNLSTYQRYGRDPYGTKGDWMAIDKEKPFSFIRACIELANVSVGQVSYLIVEQDGSNNGLAWQSILIGDKEMAAQTNLLGGHKQDLYGIVGESLEKKYPQASYAECRKISKIAVMEYGYGAGSDTIAEDLRDWAQDNRTKAAYLTTLDLTLTKKGRDYKVSDGLLQVAEDAIEALTNVCSGTKEFRDTVYSWYRDHMVTSKPSAKFKERYYKNDGNVNAPLTVSRVIDTICRAGDGDVPAELLKDWVEGKVVGYKAITYVTPSGFPVHVEKTESIKMAAKLKVSKRKTVEIVAYWSDGTPAINKMVQSALANTVHSIDAAHVHQVLNAALFDVTTVHDAFACHPNHAEDLRRILMESMKFLADQWPIRLLAHQGTPIGFVEFPDEIVKHLQTRLADPTNSEKQRQWIQEKLSAGGMSALFGGVLQSHLETQQTL